MKIEVKAVMESLLKDRRILRETACQKHDLWKGQLWEDSFYMLQTSRKQNKSEHELGETLKNPDLHTRIVEDMDMIRAVMERNDRLVALALAIDKLCQNMTTIEELEELISW